MNIRLVNKYELVDQAFKIALEHGITIYDALYVALALRLKEPLLTYD